MPITEIRALDERGLRFQAQAEVKFVRAFNTDIIALNTEIRLYNSTTGEAEKLAQLQQVDKLRNTLNNQYYLDDITRFPSYQAQMHDQLDREIRAAFDALAPLKEDDLASLPEVIRQMPHKKFTQLMAILWKNTELAHKLNTLYRKDDLPSYTHFQQFLKSHTIESLSVGMAGNSRNIKICKIGLGNTPVVLKVDKRFGRPKSTEDYLRQLQVGALAPTYGQRQGTFLAPNGEKITATLVITEYCPGSDLSDHAKKQQTDEARLSSALDYYTQMADILGELQLNEVAFPDAKNENWLIGRDNKLRLSDTKSLLRTSNGEVAAFNQQKDDPRSFPIRTGSHLPAELSPKSLPKSSSIFLPKFSADAMHVYMLGKNLYQSLTNCAWERLAGIKSLSLSLGYPPHFGHLIFQKVPIGSRLKALLSRMVQYQPADRISLAAATKELKDLLAAQPVADDIEQIMHKIQRTERLPQTSSEMKKFIDDKTSAMVGLDVSELKKMKNELKNLYQKLVLIADEVDTMVLGFRSAIFSKESKSEKATKIEQAFRNIPVADRVNVLTHRENKKIQDFQNALAWHRTAIKKGELNQSHLTPRELTKKTAANTFNKFKERLEDVAHRGDPDKEGVSSSQAQPNGDLTPK